MKKLLIFVAIVNMLFASNESEVKLDALMQYQAPSNKISIDYNPFINQSKIDAITNNNELSALNVKRDLRLIAVINQKAYINGHWYRVGQSVDGNKIVKIHEQSVELRKGNKTTILAFEEAKSLLHVKDSKQ